MIQFELRDKDENLIADIEANYMDFPWLLGKLLPRAKFEEYRDTFESAEFYKIKSEEASDHEKSGYFSDKELAVYEEQESLGFLIWSKSDQSYVKTNTINICGLEIEWK